MSVAPSSRITELLRVWSAGDQTALQRIIELAYPELRKIARGCLRGERPGHTMQATALLHEAYLRLIDIRRVQWQDRVHFFALGARMMRRILVDYARSRGCAIRGGENRHVNLDEVVMVSAQPEPDLLRLDDALRDLSQFDPRKAQVVEMRYFGGLTAEEIASVLDVSPQTVHRDWSLAKAWLVRQMIHEEGHGRSAVGSD
jgi:RNA polymerase sigma factor (TIGR02999 family)